MNKIYKVIWSKVRNCYVAVSEIAKRNGKSCTSVNCGAKANRGRVGAVLSAAVGATLLAGVCSILMPVRVALAAPELPTLPTLDVNGKSADVTIVSTTSAASATMNINSTQQNNVLKWIDFSIGKGGTVQFDPNNYLNYVTGHGRSEIDGTLTGAGNIYLINPNGILFGSNASVNVGNLYLSTRTLGDSDFDNFTNNGTNPLATAATSAAGDIVNLGKLNATNITVEGKNISFKNVEEVTPATAMNVRASGEVHVGYVAGPEINEVNNTQYTDGYVTRPDEAFAKWNVKRLNGTDNIASSKYTEYMLIRNAYELQNMQNRRSQNNDYVIVGNYMLANDIDFNGTTFNDSTSSLGFIPIGYTDTSNKNHSFRGKFDGLNFTISNLKITDTTLEPYDVVRNIGLFGCFDTAYNGGVIENVGVVDTNIDVNKSCVGGVVGWNAGGTIRNVYHSGSVKGIEKVGGIVGANDSSTSSVIENAYNTGDIDATASGQLIGGIVGLITKGSVSQVYNTGKVGYNSDSLRQVGGIAGKSQSGKIENAYNIGAVKGITDVGGIVGNLITDSAVGKVINSYNIGTVKMGDSSGGGIVGSKGSGTQITSSYFSQGDGTYGGTPQTLGELKLLSTFAGSDIPEERWSISATGGAKTTWRISEGQTTPQLTAFLKTKDYIEKKTYDGTADVNTTKSDGTTHQADGLAKGFDYVQDVSVIEPKELLLVANKISIKNGEGSAPDPYLGTITGFVLGQELSTGDKLSFTLDTPSPTMAGSYKVTGTLNGAESGTYGTNYTFTNDPANETAFSIVVDVMPKLDFKGASPYVTIASTPDTMNISSLQTNNVLKWMDFSIDKDGTVNFDTNNYLNYVTGHGRSEIDGTLTGGGNIYLINPNGMVFGSTAQVNVGNLYLSTRRFDVDDLKSFDNNSTDAMEPLSSAAASATGDIVNLGTLTAANITAEGNNISFKNVEDVSVTGTGKINVRASREVHVGYAASAKVDEVNDTEYTVGNITLPDLSKWSFKGLDNSSSVEPTQYMLVRNAFELQNMKNNLTGNYMLANDIEFKNDSNELIIENFKTVGSLPDETGSKPGMFQGRIDGLNHVIRNINITNTNNESYASDVGIIGSNAGIVENLGVIDGNINVSKSFIGGIVGRNKSSGVIRNVYFSGSVTGSNRVGGISGGQDASGVIEKAYNTGTITATSSGTLQLGIVGGIVGYNGYDGTNNKKVSEVFNAGTINGYHAGGIAGRNNGTVENAYNEGTVPNVGGSGAIVSLNDGTIKYSYNANKSLTYMTSGAIPGTRSYSINAKDNSDSDMKSLTTYANKSWDISDIGADGKTWRIYEGQTMPLLTAFLKTKDVITETEYTGAAQQFDENLVTGDNHITATDVGGYASETNAGKHEGLTGETGDKVLYSDQLGYDLVDTKLIIQPKRVSLVNADKTYDGTKDVNTLTLNLNTADIIGSDSAKVTLVNNNVTGTYADKNVGDGKAITYTIADDDGALTGTAKGNYIISAAGTGNITAKTLSLVSVSKVYDGTANVEAGDIALATDKIEGDEAVFNGSKISGLYSNENAEDGKTVTYTVNSGALTGADAGNYIIATAGTGAITPRTVTLDKTISKVYDATDEATPTVDALSNVIEADKTALTITATSATFSDVNVGDELTVTYAGLQLGGPKAGNYSLEATDATVLNNSITQRPVTLTGTISKVYDGTKAAIPSAHTLENVIAEDLPDLDLSATKALFDNKNVGDNRTITYEDLSLSGEKAVNYTLTSTNATIYNNSITRKELALVADKVGIKKGGTVPGTFTGDLTGFVPGEELPETERSNISFTVATPLPTTAGSYAITGKFYGAESGNYLDNYTFKNAESNKTAFTIFTDMMPKLDLRGGDIKAASPYVTIDDTTANTMVISSTQDNNVLKWIDFSIDSGGTVKYDAKNYLNFVTGHGRSEIYGTLTGDGNIYLINPNGILFGSDAKVDVGSLHLSTRNLTEPQLADYTTGVAALYQNDNAAVGDITNLGWLNADLIEAEGRNISFKNVEEVTKGGTLTDGEITGGTAHYQSTDGSVTLTVNNVEADPDNNVKENKGEIHLGFAVSDTLADRVNTTQYTNVTTPTLTGWTANVTPIMYMLVHNEYELQNMNNNLTKENGSYMPGHYMLANDIDASLFKFMPVGSVNNSSPISTGVFKGKFDGLYHVIKDITIDKTSVRSGTTTDIGIIGSNAGTVENLGVVNGTVDATGISSNSAIGGIVGANKAGAVIRNVYFSGSVKVDGKMVQLL